MLAEMDAMDAFSTTVSVPALTSLAQISALLDSVALFPPSSGEGAQGASAEKERVMRALEQAGVEDAAREGRWAVGVKRLLGICEMCRQDGDRAGDKLVAELVGLML